VTWRGLPTLGIFDTPPERRLSRFAAAHPNEAGIIFR
jgi:hypothetical protein